MASRIIAAAVAAALAPALAAAQSFPEVSFSGFGTLGAVRTDTDRAQYATSVLQPKGADKDWNFGVDSVIAGQVNARFTPALSAVAQIVANKRAQDDFHPHVEWAFARYAVTPDLAVRGGILAVPVFMLSESRLVGLSFPWVRPPTALYSQAPITNFRGVDVTYRISAGDATINLQPYAGQAPTDVPGSSGGVVHTDLDRVLGINAVAEMGSWTLRAGYFQGRFTYHSASTDALFAGLGALAGKLPGAGELYNQLYSDDRKISFSSVGLGYDGGNVLFQAEYGRRKTELFLADTSAWYASLGWRFGNVTPHVTYSDVNVNSPTSQRVVPAAGPLAPLAAGINSLLAGQNVAQKTAAVGVRWQFHKNADVKIQWDHVKLPEGAVGNFHGTPGFADKVDVYSVAVDFVF